MQEDDLTTIEAQLERLARTTSYPPTPSLTAAVGRRLRAGALAPRRLAGWRWALAPGLTAAIAAALLAFALVLAVSSGAREAVADFFGLSRLRVSELEEEPAGMPSEIASLPRETIGTPVSLEEAQELSGFAVRLPAYPPGIGEPDQVLLQRFGERVGLVLVYDRPGLAFTLLQTTGSIGKGLAFEATTEPAQVGDSFGLWLQGQRVLAYLDEAGRPIEESRRVTDVNTLIWEDGRLLFRLEGDLSLEEAVRIAESVR